MAPILSRKSSDLSGLLFTLRVFIILNTEDVFIETLKARADGVHGECVSAEVDEGRVVGEGEHGSSWVESDRGVPGREVGGRFFGEVAVNGLIVEVPLISVLSLDHVVEEDVPPLGADDGLSQFIGDDWVSPVYVEIVEKTEAVCYFLEGAVVVLVHWSGVEAEVACHVLVVVAGSCQGHLSSDTVASKSSHRNFLLVHEAGDIV